MRHAAAGERVSPESGVKSAINTAIQLSCVTQQEVVEPVSLEGSVEAHPTISIELLRRSGALSPDELKAQLYNDEGDWTLSINREMTSLKIELIERFDEHVWFVKLTSAPASFGVRYYFTCPITRSRVTKIHLINGRWGARRAFLGALSKTPSRAHRQEEQIQKDYDRIVGRNGHPVARGAARRRILERLWHVPLILFRYPELEDIFRVEERRANLPPATPKRTLRWSTEAALQAGKRLATSEARDLLNSAERDSAVSASHGVLNTATTPWLYVEGQPCLDVRALAKAGLLAETVAGHKLVWKGPNDQTVSSAAVIVVQRSGEPRRILIEPIGSACANPVRHWVMLASAPHQKRTYLVCPRSGARSDILFLRDGVFGSAKASCLRHRSQRKQT